jgi:hypothetical protein
LDLEEYAAKPPLRTFNVDENTASYRETEGNGRWPGKTNKALEIGQLSKNAFVAKIETPREP